MTMVTASIANTQATALITALSTAGEIRIYAGTPPATADTALSSNDLLATFNLPNPAGTASGGIFTYDCDPDLTDTSTVAGTATFARATDSGGSTTIAQYTVGTSGEDINFDSVTFTTGGTATLTALTHTVPLTDA